MAYHKVCMCMLMVVKAKVCCPKSYLGRNVLRAREMSVMSWNRFVVVNDTAEYDGCAC